MTDTPKPQEKLSALGADLSGAVDDALSKARPVFNHMADQFSENLQDLAQRGKETALEAEHRIEKEARHARRSAERYIRHAPFQSVMMAAGTGAAVALAVSWWVHMRKH